MRPNAAACLLALAAASPLPAARPSPSGEEQLAGYTRGLTPGEPASCIPQFRTNVSHTIPGIGVVYEVGATPYVMRFRDGCDQLTDLTLFVTDTPTGQLCEGDAASIYDSSPSRIFLGTCIIGKFVPYKRQG